MYLYIRMYIRVCIVSIHMYTCIVQYTECVSLLVYQSHIMRHHTRLSVMSMETLTQKVRGKKGEPHTKEDHSPPQRTVDPHEEGKLVPLKPDLSKAMLLSYGPVSISRDDLLLKVCVCASVRPCVRVCVCIHACVCAPMCVHIPT